VGVQDLSVVIIGAGFSGIAAAVQLLESGVTDFVVLEREFQVGGTWRDAVYPGAEVDVPSPLYCLSFAPNPDWTSMNSAAPEILRYIQDVVERFDVAPHIRFGAEVVRAEFDEPEGKWHVATADGLLANSDFPEIPGMEEFAGHKMLSASWDRDYDVAGKRVAVVGTGASAVQIVPELVKKAGHVVVFQRTPAWVIPRSNFRFPTMAKKLFRRFPATQRALRNVLYSFYEALTMALVWVTPLTKVVETFSKVHLRMQVKDKVLRRQLTPNYRVGCKRPLITSAFYPALQQENATLVPHAVVELTESGLRANDGSEHELDCIVFATGYDVGSRGAAFTVAGLDGRKLGDEWSGGMVGYKSVSVAGYPNLFWIMGPNAFGHSSELLFIEEQVKYSVTGVLKILELDLRMLDVKPEAQAVHNRELQSKLAKTTFNSGCHSWYLSENRYNGMMFPGSVGTFRRQMATFELDDYTIAAVDRVETRTR
jgi:cation diffusion facilitator CzcD-associated flavoprotein CzcO